MSEFGFRPPCNTCSGQCGCHNQPSYNPNFPPGGNYYPPPPGPGGPPHYPPPGPGGPPFHPPHHPHHPHHPPHHPGGGPGYQPGYKVEHRHQKNRHCSSKHGNKSTCAKSAYNWVDSYSGSGPPPDAVQGGTDVDGQPIYVGRAYHDGDWIPAKVIPGRRVAYIAYNMKEVPVDRYQILVGQSSVYWVQDSSGRVPQNAIQAGKTKEGETLFIGRVNHACALTVGKVHPSHRVCYISFDGKELSFPSYEVLVSYN